MEENRVLERVFHNDAIMRHILSMLSLREQYEVQKVSPRWRRLMIKWVWNEDCNEMEMNRNHFGSLTDDEFFDLLTRNADNVRALTIAEEDGAEFRRYFRSHYENLRELHVEGFRLAEKDLADIVSNCPRLEMFDYNEGRDASVAPNEEELRCVEMLRSLINLKVLILRDLFQAISYGTLQLLASTLPLERLEWHGVRINGTERNSKSYRNTFETLQILKTDCSHLRHCEGECLKFVQKCPNLRELQMTLSADVAINQNFFEKFPHLEIITLKGCSFVQALEIMMKLNKLKNVNIVEEGSRKIADPNLKTDIKSCLKLLKMPTTLFRNLQELSLSSPQVNDEFVRMLTRKCSQLKKLHLTGSKIRGEHIHRLRDLQSLTLENNLTTILGCHLFAMLVDLRQLESLILDVPAVAENEFSLHPPPSDLGSSLQVLKIIRTDDQMAFWKHIWTQWQPRFFENVHTVHIEYYRMPHKFGMYWFFVHFPSLRCVQLDACFKLRKESFITNYMPSNIEHMALVNCERMDWTHILRLLRNSKVHTLDIFDMSIKVDYATKQPDHCFIDDIMNDLRCITMPFDLLQETYDVWHQFIEATARFQVCCMGQYSHDIVLDLLLDNSTAMQRIRCIYANTELDSLKKYCAENIKTTSKVPVCLLDENNKRLWNHRFTTENLVIIIEFSK